MCSGASRLSRLPSKSISLGSPQPVDKSGQIIAPPHLVADTALLILEAVPDTVKPVKGVRLLPLV